MDGKCQALRRDGARCTLPGVHGVTVWVEGEPDTIEICTQHSNELDGNGVLPVRRSPDGAAEQVVYDIVNEWKIVPIEGGE